MGDLFAIGRVVKPHGLKGGMKAVSYLESEELLPKLEEIFLDDERRQGQSFKVRRIDIKKKSFILTVDGIGDAETAAQYVGRDILASSSKLDTLPEGEYYWRDLIGLEVRTEEGLFLGKIESVFPTGSNDVYVCTGGERDILLPTLADVVRKVDVDKGIMVVRLYRGL